MVRRARYCLVDVLHPPRRHGLRPRRRIALGITIRRGIAQGIGIPLPPLHIHSDTRVLGGHTQEVLLPRRTTYEADDDFPRARRDAPVGARRECDPLPLAMSLVNAVTLSAVSVVCVCEITIFSHRFRTLSEDPRCHLTSTTSPRRARFDELYGSPLPATSSS
jgi:hypothetical protein